jgi:DNA polymerase III epsilon subunit-like protein
VELDVLIERYGASCPVRHNALGDAYATAQLFLVALQQAEDKGLHTALDLFRKQTSTMTHLAQSDARMSGA